MSKWLPSLNSLRAFEVVSRHLNYHTAATELNVTPAAVKQLVGKLEDTIGSKLLRRKGQSLELTPRGEACCDDLSQAFGDIYEVVKKMRRKEKNQQLIITVETSLATSWLVPKLDRFRAIYPNINVLIDSSQHIASFKKDHFDVGIRYGVKNQGDLFTHRLFKDKIFPACSPSLTNGTTQLFTLDRLNSIPLIHWDLSQLDWAHETRKWFSWERWLLQVVAKNINTERGLFFSDYGQAVQAAIAGQGVFLASWPILKEPIDAGVLVCPFNESITTDIGYDLVSTMSARERPEVRVFIEWIIQMAEA